MPTELLTPAGDLDRAALMADAHRRFADGQRLGLEWSFGRCLATAMAAAKIQRETKIMEAIAWRVLNMPRPTAERSSARSSPKS